MSVKLLLPPFPRPCAVGLGSGELEGSGKEEIEWGAPGSEGQVGCGSCCVVCDLFLIVGEVGGTMVLVSGRGECPELPLFLVLHAALPEGKKEYKYMPSERSMRPGPPIWRAFLTEGEGEICSVVSDSLRPHELYSPWTSPGQNTGVGSLSLLRGNLLTSGIKPRSPALQVDSLPAESQGWPNNTGVSSLSLLQGNFPTQELNLGLLHCRRILYQLSYQGSSLKFL